MPIIGTIPKKDIDSKYETIQELLEKCESCEMFKGQTPSQVVIYTIYKEYTTKDGEAMIAIAKYGNTYAIHPAKYLQGKQWKVLSFLLNDMEDYNEVAVFSEELKKKSAGTLQLWTSSKGTCVHLEKGELTALLNLLNRENTKFIWKLDFIKFLWYNFYLE